MASLTITVRCPIHDSFRVQQIAGMFDVPLADKLTERFTVEVPDDDEPWQIGLISGPSGSGKSTIARELFGAAMSEPEPWPADRAVIDGFGELPVRRITDLLTAVGFSSPPSWLKPYSVLSAGERFRCDLARALSGNLLAANKSTTNENKNTGSKLPEAHSERTGSKLPVPPLVVCDEFTSVVDRTVAKIGSAAVANALRDGRIPGRFVAVSCHADVAEWLSPDWLIDTVAGTCSRRRLRRPAINLHLVRCRPAAWALFKRHHYLSGALNLAARCYLALWEQTPVCFCAVLPLVGRRRRWRITRLVTLPDFQGIGIGLRVAETVAELYRAAGLRMNITASHPAVIGHCRRSPLWKAGGVKKFGSRPAGERIRTYRGSRGRASASFEYVGKR